MENDTPRRNRLDLCTPAELAIYNAMGEIEKAGADVRLTSALTLLVQAKKLVADFVDSQEPKNTVLTVQNGKIGSKSTEL